MSIGKTFFREYSDHTFTRIINALQEITLDELNWTPVPEMNNLKQILRHTARISYILLPQVLEGTTTGDWDDDYEKKEHTIEEMLRNLEEGRKKVLLLLDNMTIVDFDLEIPIWGRIERKKTGFYMLISEIDWHGGQIALIRGAYKRRKKS
jgi:hypothetical protein